ncbi:hypothetical protein [Limisphaera sp. VF-2]|jgi:small-conductance mechanosensitive channel|uniref:hypothetical protein n=1 Tax=Limisphaera sp. VF-2 TaxID=3400418 RepID=UPI00176B674F|nr:hypothetical protein [Limisphaera sp.]
MTRLLQAPWLAALVGGLLYLGVTLALLSPARLGVPTGFTPSSPPRERRPPDDLPSWRFRNPELQQWIAELQRERELLAQREQQLKDWEIRLQAEQQELATITQTVARLQAEFDRNVIRLQEAQQEHYKRQAKLLTGMSVEGQLAMLQQMPDDDIVRLFLLMRNDDVSQVLDAMSKAGSEEAKRAVLLIEKMRRALPPASTNATAARTSAPGP